MDCCRVVGFRGLCRPLDEKQGFPTNTSPLAPCQGCSKAEQSRTTSCKGQGRFSCGVAPSDRPRKFFWRKLAGSVPGPAQKTPSPGNLPAWRPRPPWRYPPDHPRQTQKSTSLAMVVVWGPSLLPNGREVNGGAGPLQSSYTGRLYPPSPF